MRTAHCMHSKFVNGPEALSLANCVMLHSVRILVGYPNRRNAYKQVHCVTDDTGRPCFEKPVLPLAVARSVEQKRCRSNRGTWTDPSFVLAQFSAKRPPCYKANLSQQIVLQPGQYIST